MKKMLLLLALAAPFAASAQGFQDEPTCYSWEGGHKSSGSFSKCPQPWKVAAPAAKAPVVAAPVVSGPIMMPITCAPAPKPVIKHKPKPKVQC